MRRCAGGNIAEYSETGKYDADGIQRVLIIELGIQTESLTFVLEILKRIGSPEAKRVKGIMSDVIALGKSEPG
jgi:hypothetical protein